MDAGLYDTHQHLARCTDGFEEVAVDASVSHFDPEMSGPYTYIWLSDDELYTSGSENETEYSAETVYFDNACEAQSLESMEVREQAGLEVPVGSTRNINNYSEESTVVQYKCFQHTACEDDASQSVIEELEFDHESSYVYCVLPDSDVEEETSSKEEISMESATETAKYNLTDDCLTDTLDETADSTRGASEVDLPSVNLRNCETTDVGAGNKIQAAGMINSGRKSFAQGNNCRHYGMNENEVFELKPGKSHRVTSNQGQSLWKQIEHGDAERVTHHKMPDSSNVTNAVLTRSEKVPGNRILQNKLTMIQQKLAHTMKRTKDAGVKSNGRNDNAIERLEKTTKAVKKSKQCDLLMKEAAEFLRNREGRGTVHGMRNTSENNLTRRSSDRLAEKPRPDFQRLTRLRWSKKNIKCSQGYESEAISFSHSVIEVNSSEILGFENTHRYYDVPEYQVTNENKMKNIDKNQMGKCQKMSKDFGFKKPAGGSWENLMPTPSSFRRTASVKNKQMIQATDIRGRLQKKKHAISNGINKKSAWARMNSKHNVSYSTSMAMLEQTGITASSAGILHSISTGVNSSKYAKQTGLINTRVRKMNGRKQLNCIKEKTKTRGTPVAKFPCMYCEKQYGKPYLYTHLNVHRKKGQVRRWQKGSDVYGAKQRRDSSHSKPVKKRVAPCRKVVFPVKTKPHKCCKCNYSTRHLCHLQKHKKVHQCSKNVWCHHCNVIFKSPLALKIWHTKNKVKHPNTATCVVGSKRREVIRGTVVKSKRREVIRRTVKKGKRQEVIRGTVEKSKRREVIRGTVKKSDIENRPVGQSKETSRKLAFSSGRMESTDNRSAVGKYYQTSCDIDNNNYVESNVDACDMLVSNASKTADVGIDNRSITADTASGNDIADHSGNAKPVSSLACVSCDFVANSMEILGSHFIANHFLDSASTDNNNNNNNYRQTACCEPLSGRTETNFEEFRKVDTFSCKEALGGFAKKYKAKMQKPIYAIINKQCLAERKEVTSKNETWRKDSRNKLNLTDDNFNLTDDNFNLIDDNNNINRMDEVQEGDKARLETKDINANLDQAGSCSSTAMELLSCLVCDSCFPLKADLLKHLSRIHRLTNLCQLCYFNEGKIQRFANPVSLRNHKLRCHPDDMVKCTCGTMLIDEKMLMAHLRKFKCDQSENEKYGKRMVKCVCGKRFGSLDLLSGHKIKCRKRSHDEDSESNVSVYSYEGVDVGGECGNTSLASQTRSSKSADEGSYIPEIRRRQKSTKYSMMEEEKEMDDSLYPAWKMEKALKMSDSRNRPKQPVLEGSINKEIGKEASVYSSNTAKWTVNTSIGRGKKAENPQTSKLAGMHQQGSRQTRQKKCGPRRKRPDAEGRYPCKVCRRRFKRPYLYVHQKTVHQRKQWVLVPTAASYSRTDDPRGKTFRCGWCKYVAVHWRNVVQHHYSKHHGMELDVIPMVAKTSP